MSIASQTIEQSLSSDKIRAFDPRSDLEAVADLIELGFAENLDEDGDRFLRQMRAAARSYRSMGWLAAVGTFPSPSMSGYVWQEDDRVVANVSLFPFVFQGHRQFLIANVVVHPDFRRQGIARQLTARAIEHVRTLGSPGVWLHVREENYAATTMYNALGFRERFRRTTWLMGGDVNIHASSSGFQVGPVHASDWGVQKQWLQRAYPAEITWHIPLRPNLLRPGAVGWIARFFQNVSVQQWAVRHKGQLLAVLTHQSNFQQTDYQWLAASSDADPGAIFALLAYVRKQLLPRHKVQLDYPALQFRESIESAGYRRAQTLIWMKLHIT